MTVFRTPPDIARLNQHGRDSLLENLGIEFTEAGADFLRGRMPVDARTRQPYGLLHGGASVALAETLGSAAGNCCLDPDRSVAVGLEISANHLRPMTQGWVIGTARAIHVGRSTQVWDIRIEDEAGHMVCISRLTLAVVPKQ
jgi:1,4-dihydroxy-2-naphthoyl-CoA hydrolase